MNFVPQRVSQRVDHSMQQAGGQIGASSVGGISAEQVHNANWHQSSLNFVSSPESSAEFKRKSSRSSSRDAFNNSAPARSTWITSSRRRPMAATVRRAAELIESKAVRSAQLDRYTLAICSLTSFLLHR